ncbi:MAG: VanZ family protein [Armatimonadetes bacterium]|nr:VanZ family protein [Armatimonadota bacterium]
MGKPTGRQPVVEAGFGFRQGFPSPSAVRHGKGPAIENAISEEQEEQKRKENLFLLWLYPVLWTVFLLLLSTELGSVRSTQGTLFRVLGFFWPGVFDLAPAQQEWIQFALRKTAHFTEYAIFGVLLLRAFHGSGAPLRKAGFYTWGAVILLAGLDEFHQSFVPSRTPNPKDSVIDLAGGTFGISLYFALASFFSRRSGGKARRAGGS